MTVEVTFHPHLDQVNGIYNGEIDFYYYTTAAETADWN